MASNALVFTILAKDRASREFNKVGDAADNAGKKGSKFGAAMKAGLAVGATAAVAFGKKSIDAASNMEETLSKSTVIFGDQAKEMEKWSKTAATSFGLSQSAALDAAAGFGNMLTQIGFTGDAAADNSKQIVQMAADLGSFNNVDPSDVLDKISGAMRGEYDSLQALIPNINAARVEQEALAATGKKTAKELTAQEKATATLAIIQKDGAMAAGDFAKTSGGLANQQRILRARFDDVSAQVGAKLLPVVVDLLGKFVQMIEFTKRNRDTLVPLVAILGSLAAVVWVVNKAAKAYAAVQAALNVVLAANPIGLVIIGLAALAAGLFFAYKKSDSFRGMVDRVWQALRTAGGWVADTGRKVKTWIVDKFVSAHTLLKNFQERLEDFELPGWIKTLADAVGSIGGGFKSAASKLDPRNWGDGLGIGGEGGQPRGVQQMMATVRSAFPGTPLISGLRPGAVTPFGNRSYHAQGRAVDLPPNMKLFHWIRANFGKNSKELFFSPADAQGLNVNNGQPYRLKPRTKKDHWDHIHWAMDGGGIIGEPVRGVGLRSGQSYLFGENGPETVLPGVHGPGGGVNIYVTVQGSVTAAQDLARVVRDEFVRMDRKGFAGVRR